MGVRRVGQVATQTWQAMEDALSATSEKVERLSSMYGQLCTMDFRKGVIPADPLTPKSGLSVRFGAASLSAPSIKAVKVQV